MRSCLRYVGLFALIALLPVAPEAAADDGDPAAATALAERYVNPALGFVQVVRDGARTIFDFGEYSSEVASKKNPDGTTSFSTIAPGIVGLEFVVGAGEKKTLVMRDAQHEYVFEAKPDPAAAR